MPAYVGLLRSGNFVLPTLVKNSKRSQKDNTKKGCLRFAKFKVLFPFFTFSAGARAGALSIFALAH